MLSGFIIFYVQALYLTTMANAIMIVYPAPLAASIYAHFFLGAKIKAIRGIVKGYLTANADTVYPDTQGGENHEYYSIPLKQKVS